MNIGRYGSKHMYFKYHMHTNIEDLIFTNFTNEALFMETYSWSKFVSSAHIIKNLLL